MIQYFLKIHFKSALNRMKLKMKYETKILKGIKFFSKPFIPGLGHSCQWESVLLSAVLGPNYWVYSWYLQSTIGQV